MAEVKAIELKGIVHNATKVGVQDGQAEDIVNLRFKDGAWRSAGDGKLLNLDVSGYTNIYIHTNVYRHMLGVKGGKLWWFATASESDPNAFTAITPVEICSADVTTNITQNGNLVTVYDDSSKLFVYALFMSNADYYKVLNADTNGKASDRSLYPFGGVHFNYYAPIDEPSEETNSYCIEKTAEATIMDASGGGSGELQRDAMTTLENAHNLLIASYCEAQKRNRFTRPLLACLAVRLYDGSYAYASAPQLVWPRQLTAQKNKYYNTVSQSQTSISTSKGVMYSNGYVLISNKDFPSSHLTTGEIHQIAANTKPVYDSYIDTSKVGTSSDAYHCRLYTSDLVLSVDDISILKSNKDVFSDVCVFITPEIDYFKIGEYDWKKSWQYNEGNNPFVVGVVEDNGKRRYSYVPAHKTSKEINNELLRSQFYLLRKYSISELSLLENGVIVDLQDKEYDGVLSNIVQQDTLPVEAFVRSSYRPKYVFEYNGRNHLANYDSIQFHGFPIDTFNNNGYSVVETEGSYVYNVLKGLSLYNNDKYQYSEGSVSVTKEQTLIDNGTPYFIIRTLIDTNDGQQRVARYFIAYDPTTPKTGRLDTIHDLSPVLSFPDSHAKSMSIYYVTKDQLGTAVVKGKSFELKPAAYANVAYYMSEDLMPIRLDTFRTITSVGLTQTADSDFNISYDNQTSNVVQQQ